MANDRSPHSPGRAGDAPWEVEITVLPAPPRPGLRERMGHLRDSRPRLTAALMLGAAMLGVIAVVAVSGTSSSPPGSGNAAARAPGRGNAAARAPGRGNAAARAPGPAGVAAAYGYPARCLSVSITPGAPAYARADFSHRAPCGRFAGDPTAVFHRVDGAWRPVLEAVVYTCPVRSLPRRVQAELGVCPGGP